MKPTIYKRFEFVVKRKPTGITISKRDDGTSTITIDVTQHEMNSMIENFISHGNSETHQP